MVEHELKWNEVGRIWFSSRECLFLCLPFFPQT